MKNFSKKGFSLLEVMLAVAIMATASSMIMYGFLTSMNYANNSSIYARVAAANAGSNYDRMGQILSVTVTNTGTGSRSATLAGFTPTEKHIAVQGGGLDISLDAGALRFTDDGASNAATFNVTAGAAALDSDYAIAIEGTGDYDNATVSDNRTSFFYTIPDVNWAGYNIQNGECPICHTPYSLVMMRRGGEPASNGNFHWVCANYLSDSPYDHSAYRAAVTNAANW